MIEAHNPVAVGYQIGGCLGLILAGFLADTWLWFAVVALSSAAGGILAGLIARSIIRLARRTRGQI
jgi:lipid-binding SYLF domain-containing protein